MGAIPAKFRKAKTTTEVLEGLEEKIMQIEKYSRNTQDQQKRFVGNFLAISIGIYVIAFLVFYFIYFPPTWRERTIYSVPLFIFPLVIILLRRLFTWYFQRKLNKNSNKLTVLRTEKKKILEQVMDKETYKVASKLLERFGDKNNGARSALALTPRISNTSLSRPSLNQTLSPMPMSSRPQQQQLSSFSSLHTSLTASPRPMSMLQNQTLRVANPTTALTPLIRTDQQLRRRTPFPIVNQQGKGVLERIVDVLIGDGPGDRFAMICKKCFAHNGMALKEEFDYATFRCAFCNDLNRSRKERPIAPRLPEQHSMIETHIAANDSSSDTDGSEMSIERHQVPHDESHPASEANATTAPETEEEDIETVKPTEYDVNNSTEEEEEEPKQDQVKVQTMQDSAEESEDARLLKLAEEFEKLNAGVTVTELPKLKAEVVEEKRHEE